jgi:hypothetical protein
MTGSTDVIPGLVAHCRAAAQPATVEGAVAAVRSGPLGQNGIRHCCSIYSIGNLVYGPGALVAHIANAMLGGRRNHDGFIEPETVGLR